MIVNYEDLPSIRQNHQQERLVFGGGVFDLVHEGHVAALEYWKSLGNILIVGVVSDERVRQRKGDDRPIRDEVGRLAVVNAFRAVDYSFILPLPKDGVSPTVQSISKFQPDVFVQYQDSHLVVAGDSDPLIELGVEIVIDDRPKLDSTSRILARATGEFVSQ